MNSERSLAEMGGKELLPGEEPEPQSIAVDLPVMSGIDQNSWLLRHWQKVVAGAFWLTVFVSYLWFARNTGTGPIETVRLLVDAIQLNPFGPLLFVAAYVLRPFIFFPASPLSVAGGFLFGPVVGILITMIAANLSALVAYLLGRYFGQDIQEDADSRGIVQRYAERMRANSFETVLILRFVFLPYDLINYLAGVLRINWKAFLLATAIGNIPGTISFVLFGASIERFDGGLPSLNPWVLALAVGIFVVSLTLTRFFKRREQKKRA